MKYQHKALGITATVIIAAVGMLASSPVLAGKLIYADGRGAWMSTQCPKPQPPAITDLGSEAAADDINGAIARHNEYATNMSEYMSCMSEEASRDAAEAGQMAIRSVKATMAKIQAEVESDKNSLNSRAAE